MRVRDVMTSTRLVTACPDDGLALAAQMMLWSNSRHLPVVREGQVVGVVSQRDLVGRDRAGRTAAAALAVRDVMHGPAVTVNADAPLAEAVSLMFERKLGCLPVLANGSLVGIITTTDLLRHQLDASLTQRTERLPRTVRAFMKPVPKGATASPDLFDAAALIVRADAPLGAAVAELLTQNVGVLPVVDEVGTLVGTLSYLDLIRALSE